MIRFAWRQARAQTAIAATAIAVVVIVVALAGRDSTTLRLWLGVLIITVPAILGMFCGAPLVAGELEDGTFRLAWTQSVTRTRWLAAKLAVTGLASIAVAGLLSLIVTWWASPLDRAVMSQFGSFDERDIVPLGYAAFGFALGVAVGALLRRTLPAMLTTLVVFTASRIAVRTWIRPYLIHPLTRALALNPASTGYGSEGFLPLAPAPALEPSPPDIPNAWITAISIVNKNGSALTASDLARICPGLSSDRPSGGGGHVKASQAVVTRLQDCVARVGTTFHEVVTYQPANRYWPLQWYELAIFLAASVVLAGVCVWRVRRLG
jgi:ABC-2 family transporter protein